MTTTKQAGIDVSGYVLKRFNHFEQDQRGRWVRRRSGAEIGRIIPIWQQMRRENRCVAIVGASGNVLIKPRHIPENIAAAELPLIPES